MAHPLRPSALELRESEWYGNLPVQVISRFSYPFFPIRRLDRENRA